MNPQVKEKWVDALRSGEYQQATGRLRSNDGFCCLGVLCDLYAKENNKEWQYKNAINGSEYWRFDDSLETLPQTVIEWAELNDDCPVVRYDNPEDCWITVALLNDRGINFKVLADLIEEQL